jgi:hypothetical protein
LAVLKDMYNGKPYSPPTTLSAAVSSDTTNIPVVDATVFPPAPNLAVISNYEIAETIRYTGISGNTLTGCVRGFQEGLSGYAWAADTTIARNFTEYDYEALKENIEEIHDEVGGKADTAAVSAELALKADKADVDLDLALKADKTELAAKATVYKFTAVLPSSGWGNTAPYTQTVNISGITAEMSPKGYFDTAYGAEMVKKTEYNKIDRIESFDGYAVFTCADEVTASPSMDLNVKVEVV